MKHEQGSFRAGDGLDLFYQSWLPEDRTRAVLVIVHGAGDHSGRYNRLVSPLVDRSFAAYSYDMRGYGRSPGRRGHIDAWADYREDAGSFLMFVKERSPGLPVFLFGYSLGAQVALDSVLRAPEGLEGVILSATPIEPAGIGNPMMIWMAKLLSRVMPTMQTSLRNDINGVARDPQVLADLSKDPLHHNLVSMRWGAEAMATGKWVRQHAAEMRLPVLFIHGGADPFNKVEGVQRYYDQILYPDKAIRIYPGSRHETHNDLDHAQVASDIAAWMEAHLTEL